MNVQTQWKRLLIGGAAALTLTAGTLWTVDNVSAASPTALLNQIGIQQMEGMGGRGGRGGPGGFGGPGMKAHGDPAGQGQYLADALGITLEELQAAQMSVRNTLIDRAVADGTITQEQADQMKAGERVRVPGLHMKGEFAQAVDREALLADALGITVEALQTAQSTAREAAIADALANGEITQEQVDRMAAHQALRSYVEETYGTERPDLTMADLIQEAVDAGAVTQEQADLLASSEGRMGPGGRGEHGGRRPSGRGMPGQRAPETQPNLENVPTEETDGSTT